MSIFAEQTPQTSALDEIVGEGKKYATVEDLAKATVHAQNHIATLEAEAAQWREGIQRTVEQQRQQQQNVNTPPSGQAEQRQDELNLDDRIRATIEERDRQKKLEDNVEEVTNRLVGLYGDPKKANEAVLAKAQELGVSVQFLMDSAAASPKAFYAQIGLNEGARSAPAPFNRVNPEALNTQNQSRPGQPGTYSYYENMRKENPKLYNSPKIQLEMHKYATENPNFFSG